MNKIYSLCAVLIFSFNLFAQSVIENATLEKVDGKAVPPILIELLDNGILRLHRPASRLPKMLFTDVALRTANPDAKVETLFKSNGRLFAVLDTNGQKSLHEFRLTREGRARDLLKLGAGGVLTFAAATPLMYTLGQFMMGGPDMDLAQRLNREFSQMFLYFDAGATIVLGTACGRILQGLWAPKQVAGDTRIRVDGAYLRFHSVQRDGSGKVTDLIYETQSGHTGFVSQLPPEA